MGGGGLEPPNFLCLSLISSYLELDHAHAGTSTSIVAAFSSTDHQSDSELSVASDGNDISDCTRTHLRGPRI